MRMNHREALVMCLLSCALLGGCDAEFRQPGFNPDSTYRDPDEEFKKREEAFNRPASPPPPPARLHPLTKVLNAYPKDDYEVAVLYMYEIMHTPDATQAICARWFPDYGRQTADAVNEWQKKNESLMTEISDRTHAIWIGQAEGDASVVPWAEGRFNRDRRQQYDNNFDKTPVKVYEKRCAQLPAALSSSEWDLTKRFRKQLAIMKKRPMSQVMAGTPSQPAAK